MRPQEQFADKIHAFICERFPLARQRLLGRDDSLLESGVVDSLGVLEIVTFLESEFGAVLSDEEMVSEHFESVSRLAAFVHNKLEREDASWTS